MIHLNQSTKFKKYLIDTNKRFGPFIKYLFYSVKYKNVPYFHDEICIV